MLWVVSTLRGTQPAATYSSFIHCVCGWLAGLKPGCLCPHYICHWVAAPLLLATGLGARLTRAFAGPLLHTRRLKQHSPREDAELGVKLAGEVAARLKGLLRRAGTCPKLCSRGLQPGDACPSCCSSPEVDILPIRRGFGFSPSSAETLYAGSSKRAK